jgi:hypothetical protein
LKNDTHTTHTAKTRLNVEECFEQLVKEMKSWREKKNNNTSSVRRVSTLIPSFFWAAGSQYFGGAGRHGGVAQQRQEVVGTEAQQDDGGQELCASMKTTRVQGSGVRRTISNNSECIIF